MRYQSGGATFDEADIVDMPSATQSLVILAARGRDADGKLLGTNAHQSLAKKHVQAFLDEVTRKC